MPKLIIVSNRLPINVTGKAENKWIVNKSSGGLVSALTGLQKNAEFVWLGWPGNKYIFTKPFKYLRNRCYGI